MLLKISSPSLQKGADSRLGAIKAPGHSLVNNARPKGGARHASYIETRRGLIYLL